MGEDSDVAPVFCTATGDTEALVGFYSCRGQLGEAVLGAQVACEGLLGGTQGTNGSSINGTGGLEPTAKQTQ